MPTNTDRHADRYAALANWLEDFVACAPRSESDLAQALAAANALRWAAGLLGARDKAREGLAFAEGPVIVGVEAEGAV